MKFCWVFNLQPTSLFKQNDKWHKMWSHLYRSSLAKPWDRPSLCLSNNKAESDWKLNGRKKVKLHTVKIQIQPFVHDWFFLGCFFFYTIPNGCWLAVRCRLHPACGWCWNLSPIFFDLLCLVSSARLSSSLLCSVGSGVMKWFTSGCFPFFFQIYRKFKKIAPFHFPGRLLVKLRVFDFGVWTV